MPCKMKICIFVISKSIIKIFFLSSNGCFQIQCESFIHFFCLFVCFPRIIEWYFDQKCCLMMDLFLNNTQLFASCAVNWWIGFMWITYGLLWCFYQLFGLTFWWHPFTAEDPLVNKWCNVKYHQICFDEEADSSTFSANSTLVQLFI